MTYTPEMPGQPNFALLTDPAELVRLASSLAEQGRPVGFDIETGYEGESREKASVHPEENFIVGISLTNSLDWARYVPVRHDSGPNLDNTFVAAVFWLLLTALGPDGLPLGVAHHAKFERRTMARWFLRYLAGHPRFGPEVIAAKGYPGIRSCTMLESYAEGENRSHGLKEITWANYGIKMCELLELFPEGLTKKEQRSIRFNVLDQNDPKVVAYACDDSHKGLLHHLDRYPRVKDSLIYRAEMEVLRGAVCGMEDVGLDYDWNRMREAAISGSEFADRYIIEVTRDFEDLLGAQLPPAFNFGSPQQLSRLLFDPVEGLGLPVTRRSRKTGRPSTEAKTALKGLSKDIPAVKKLLNWKGLTKLHRDFLGKFEAKYCWADDGRAHPNLLQHGTVTGRTSASDPNYQQSPKIKYRYQLISGEEFIHNFRDNIRAPLPGMRLWWQIILEEQGLWTPASTDDLGWYIIGFDYSQIELRVVAGEAGETALLDAFARGDDVHVLTASLMLGKRPEHVTDEDRDVGKTMNFALVYGMSEEGLADRLGISVHEARELFARYHAAYPRIRQWMEQTVLASRRYGYVTTRFGRKVRIWEYTDAEDASSAWLEKQRRLAGERTAGNAPIQGAATGDYKKISLARAQDALRKAGLDDRVLLVMDVHDALEWYARKDVDPADIVRVLQPAIIWDVDGWPPMHADWHFGERFGSMVKLEILPDGTVQPVRKEQDLPPVLDEETEEDLPVPPEELQPFKFTPPAGHEAYRPAWVQEPAWKELPSRPVPDAARPRTVVVTLDHMPDARQVRRFIEFIRSVPGPNTVIVRTPSGMDITADGTSGIGPQHGAEVSLCFGSALTCYDLDSVDMDKLADGIGF